VLRRWATLITIAYVQPMLNGRTVAKMVSASPDFSNEVGAWGSRI
jgi:hypothetical protein